MVLNLLLVPLQSHAFPTGGLCLDSERVVHATGQVALGVSFDQTGFERARDGTISFAGAAPVAYSFACMDEADAAFLLEECALQFTRPSHLTRASRAEPAPPATRRAESIIRHLEPLETPRRVCNQGRYDCNSSTT